MAGVQFQVNLSQLKEMQNLLRNYAQSLGSNRAELHMRYGIQALNWVDRNFRAQGGLLSTGPWAKLKPNTIAGRRKGSALVLQDTGQLRQSYQMSFTNEQAVVGSADPKALWHGLGTKPYTIVPKNAKVLAFAIAQGGRKVPFAFSSTITRHTFKRGQMLAFAKEVHHPGLPARRMLPIEVELLPALLKTTINFLKELQAKGQLL